MVAVSAARYHVPSSRRPIVHKTIDTLLTHFEKGQVSRRDVVLALSALFTSAGSGADAAAGQTGKAPIAVRSLNHASISVADVDRSVQFYQSVFGMRVISREGVAGNPIAGGGGGVVVNLAPGPGPEFIGIYKAEPYGHIGHFCLGVENFDADKALATLKERGVPARMRTRGESKEIFLTDPDNTSVQLTDMTYCGGSGPKGNICKP
jgi:catechol 2,3-dioxygenase-like lactoylglutathione lyase family enzyme